MSAVSGTYLRFWRLPAVPRDFEERKEEDACGVAVRFFDGELSEYNCFRCVGGVGGGVVEPEA